MKITLNLEKDDQNSYPGEITFSEGISDQWIFITVEGREVAVTKESFLRMCRFFAPVP